MFEAVFLDRDGTIGGDHTIHYPGDFQLFPFTYEGIKELKSCGVKIFSFTNQPGISQQLATKEDFVIELKGFGFDEVYVCPHSHREGCRCRKPEIGMLLQAAKDHNLNLENCVVIGDRWSDMMAADKAGCTKILVKTGAGIESNTVHRHRWQHIEADYVAEDLGDAVHWLFCRE